MHKRLTAILLVTMMSVCLTACGGSEEKTESTEESSTQEIIDDGETGTTQAAIDELLNRSEIINPDDMEWGYHSSDSSDPQHWYPNGDKLSESYLMFDGDFLYVRDGENEEEYSVKVEGDHVINMQEDGKALDFVFTDSLTCYDVISDKWYMRADYNVALASLTASTFYCEAGDQWNITFNEDGTYSFEQDGKLVEGDWWFQDAYTISYTDDFGETWFKITYAEDSWEIISIEDTDVFYPGN